MDFKKDKKAHTILIENQFTQQTVNSRSFHKFFFIAFMEKYIIIG